MLTIDRRCTAGAISDVLTITVHRLHQHPSIPQMQYTHAGKKNGNTHRNIYSRMHIARARETKCLNISRGIKNESPLPTFHIPSTAATINLPQHPSSAYSRFSSKSTLSFQPSKCIPQFSLRPSRSSPSPVSFLPFPARLQLLRSSPRPMVPPPPLRPSPRLLAVSAPLPPSTLDTPPTVSIHLPYDAFLY